MLSEEIAGDRASEEALALWERVCFIKLLLSHPERLLRHPERSEGSKLDFLLEKQYTGSMKTIFSILLFLIFFLTPSLFSEDEIEVRVISVGFYEVAQAEALARSMLSSQGKVTGDERTLQLVVQDYSQNCDQIEAYFKDQTLPKNIRIEVTFVGQDSGIFEARYVGWDNAVKSRGRETQMLTVFDGGKGYLHVGEKIPEPRWFFTYAKKQGIVVVDVDYRDVGSRLVVSPRIRGNRIDITLTPEISYVVDGTLRTIAFTGLSTRVFVSDGGTIELGGLKGDKAFSDRFFRSRTRKLMQIRLTPKIL